MLMRPAARKRGTPCAKIFVLAKIDLSVETNCSLKRMNVVHPPSQSNVREPGENPGRLRHCNGYKFPKCHRSESGRREGGLRPKSGYRFGCARRVSESCFGVTSPSKRRMRPACRTVFGRIRWMPSFSVLPGSEGFLFFGRCALLPRFSRTAVQTENVQSPRWSLNRKPFRNFLRNKIERSAHEKSPVRFAGAGRLVRFVRRAARPSSPKISPPIRRRTAGRFSATPTCSSGIPRIKTSTSLGIRHKPTVIFIIRSARFSRATTISASRLICN